MYVRFLALFFFIALILACQEDSFPAGLYNYQAERLLSGGDTAKWRLISFREDDLFFFPAECSDSTQLLISATADDSINVLVLRPLSDCEHFDTVSLGNANASGDLLFTDSIVFTDNSYWIIQTLTSTKLEFVSSSEEQTSFSRN